MANTNGSFEVPLEKLRWQCPQESLEFNTTHEVTPNATIIGQERALQALKLGLRLRAPGYNVYVAGPTGTGKASITKLLLEELKSKGQTPPDLCYVYNFQHPEAPLLLHLPAGRGAALAQEMDELVAPLQKNLAAVAGGSSKPPTEQKRSTPKPNPEAIKTQVQNRLAEIKNKYGSGRLDSYLDHVQTFLLAALRRWQEGESWPPPNPSTFVECKINVLVDNAKTAGAPVIIETAPTFNNLFGNIGRVQNREGLWRSDFTQIKAGALARANGGYLLFNLSDALSEAGVWRMLKRTLRHRRLEIQAHDPLEPNSASMLRPESIALDVKVVAIAELDDYHLYRHDNEFREIFKVRADFDGNMPNEASAHRQYAGFIKKICVEEHLLPFDRGAVAAVIEHGVWLTGVQNKISTRFGYIVDLLREANFWALEESNTMLQRSHIQRALDEKNFRQRLWEDRTFERIGTGRQMLDMAGKKVGQINALMYVGYLDHSYGYPARLTAAVGMGNAGIINIEREADLSGKTHNKGVAIIGGYLRSRYAHDKLLSMSASIAFEQSLTTIDGDSATAAEVYAILSALSGVPLRQDLAVTGSMNQKGEIQGVGGVNEKIEGCFRACEVKGLAGSQGVIIPQLNVEDLMLRQEIIEAVAAGKFHIYAISHIDEGLELLTGMPAGEKDAEGKYPEGTVHYKVDQRLRELNKEKKENKSPEEKKDEKPEIEKKEAANPA